MSAEVTIKGEVEVLRVQPDDKILVTFGDVPTLDLLERFYGPLKDLFPDNEVILLSGASLTIHRGETGSGPEIPE